jgi:hypothetical protein
MVIFYKKGNHYPYSKSLLYNSLLRIMNKWHAWTIKKIQFKKKIYIYLLCDFFSDLTTSLKFFYNKIINAKDKKKIIFLIEINK